MAFPGLFDRGRSSSSEVIEHKKAAPRPSAKQLALFSGRTDLGCPQCPLNKIEHELQHPKMLPTGSDEPLIYIVGEAPGGDEDREGVQFVGKAGRTLRALIPNEWLQHIRFNNVLNCRPPNNRDPAPLETACCRSRIVTDIERTKPAAIIGFGNFPFEWAVGQAERISEWRGQRIPVSVGTHTCWFYPTWHPSYINRIRNERKKGAEFEAFFETDIRRVFDDVSRGLDAPFIPQGDEFTQGIDCVAVWGSEGLEIIGAALAEIAKREQCAVDIETNALRPYNKASKILSFSAGDYDSAVAFCVEHRESRWTPRELEHLHEMIRSFLLASGRKWAHYTKFELEWFTYLYGPEMCYETEWGDTLAQAHVINPDHPKGMDDCTLRYFGFDEKKVFNIDRRRINEYPLSTVLPYNGLDVKWCDAIRLMQTDVIQREGLEEVYEMTTRRLPALVQMQVKGVKVNGPHLLTMQQDLDTRLQDVSRKIQVLPDVLTFIGKHGRFNPNGPDLVTLLRNDLKMKQGYRVVDGEQKYSTDEEVLERIDHPIAKLVRELRSIIKLKSTNTDKFTPVTLTTKRGEYLYDDDLIHSNFNHTITNTGRLASDDPNLQNVPVRTVEGRRIREAFIPPTKDLIFAKFDYGQIEFRVIGIASQDKVLCDQIWENFDVHGEWARRLATDFPHVIGGRRFISNKDVMREWRNTIKNGWTFPAFYGNVLPAIANDLNIEVHALEPHFNEFWDTYKGVKEWQTKLLDEYRKRGYVECLTKRRRYGPLSDNEAINTPVQGSASDIVVDGMERLSEQAYRQGLSWMQPIMNVHDELDLYLERAKLEEQIYHVAREMCQCVRYSFINVPLAVECEIGENWGALEKVHTFLSTEFT